MQNPATAKITVDTKLLYAQEAAHIRLTCQYERQRDISDLNVKRIAIEMTNGRFIPGTPIFFAVLPDRSMRLLNGNHTLEGIISSGKPQLLTMIFCQVADLAEADRIYSTFDIHKQRSWIDALKAVGADKDIAMPTKVMPAVGLIMHRFVPTKTNVEAVHSREARFVAMRDYKEAAALYHAAISGAPGSHRNPLLRSGLLAVALETLRYQPAKAVEFWEAAAHDDGLSAGDPRKTLLRFALTHKAAGGQSAIDFSRGAMQAWNAWWRKNSLTIIAPSRIAQVLILGTPWGTTRDGDAKSRAGRRKQSSPMPATEDGCELGGLFETGMHITEAGQDPVVLYRHNAKG